MRSIAPILCNLTAPLHLTAMLTLPALLRSYGEPPAAARLIGSGNWAMFTANHCASSIVKPDAASLSSYVGMTKSRSHLVRIRDVAFAILGFQLFFRLIGTASLDSNWCLTNSGGG
jgi:hypothetical protein